MNIELLNYPLREIKKILQETVETAFIQSDESDDDKEIINQFNLQLSNTN